MKLRPFATQSSIDFLDNTASKDKNKFAFVVAMESGEIRATATCIINLATRGMCLVGFKTQALRPKVRKDGYILTAT